MNHYDPTDLVGQQHERDERQRRDRLVRETSDGDIRWLMNAKEGRRIVWRLLEFAGVFRSSFATNALQMAFAEGHRNCGNFLLDQVMSLCPKQYAVMLAEHRPKKEQKSDGTGDQSH